jgi:hypothetical protein
MSRRISPPATWYLPHGFVRRVARWIDHRGWLVGRSRWAAQSIVTKVERGRHVSARDMEIFAEVLTYSWNAMVLFFVLPPTLVMGYLAQGVNHALLTATITFNLVLFLHDLATARLVTKPDDRSWVVRAFWPTRRRNLFVVLISFAGFYELLWPGQ